MAGLALNKCVQPWVRRGGAWGEGFGAAIAKAYGCRRGWPGFCKTSLAGLAAMTGCQATELYRVWPGPKCGSGLAREGYVAGAGFFWSECISIVAVTTDMGSALTAGHFWKDPKVTKRSSPQHSAPRLGSVCPHAGFGAWAAAMGHPWPSAANPASCRVTHAPKPAFGQRV